MGKEVFAAVDPSEIRTTQYGAPCREIAAARYKQQYNLGNLTDKEERALDRLLFFVEITNAPGFTPAQLNSLSSFSPEEAQAIFKNAVQRRADGKAGFELRRFTKAELAKLV